MTKNIFILFVTYFLFANLAFAQLPPWVPSNGLAAWYPFTGNALDSSGNKNHGTTFGPVLCPDRFGNANQAYLFAGGTNRIEVADSPSLRVRKITVSAWIKPTNSIGGEVLYKADINTAQNEIFSLNWYQVSFAFKKNSNCLPGVGWNISSYPGPITPNNWLLITSTYDGTTECNYMNGVLVNSYTFGGLMDSCAGGNLRIGYAWNSPTPPPFVGAIDDIAVYNRALTSTEVKHLYCNGIITTQPANVLAVPGNNASFSVNYVSKQPAAYQWQQDAGTGFTNLSNAGNFSGTNTAILTVGNVTSLMNNFHYRCIVSPGTTCADTTNFAILNINTTGIIEQERNISISVSPNPAKDYININVIGVRETSFGILDMYGRRLLSGRLISGQPTQVNISTIPAGIYYIKIENSNSYIKIVKNQ